MSRFHAQNERYSRSLRSWWPEGRGGSSPPFRTSTDAGGGRSRRVGVDPGVTGSVVTR